MSVYAEAFRYRELFLTLFRRDYQAKYKGSALGVLWSLANPLLLMVVYLVVFSQVLKVGANDALNPYPLFLLTGLTVWVFFSQAVTSSTRAILDNAQLVRKTKFPRQLLPFSVVATHFITFGVMLILLLPLCAIFIPRARETLLLAIPIAVLAVGLVTGLSLLVAALNVAFRDVEHLVTSLLLPWFFLTPIFYTLDQVPGAEDHPHLIEALYWGNFMAPTIRAFRDPLFVGVAPRLIDVVYVAAVSVGALLLGAWSLRKLEDRIAVEI